jgi:hypothetical protein
MKKLIGLLVIAFITTGVFGQAFIQKYSFIEKSPMGGNTIEDAIHLWHVTDGNYDWVDYVHFVKNDRLYLLSYEPNEIFSGRKRIPSGSGRDIYLYSKDINNIDSPWEQASPVVMTNLWISTITYDEVDFFIYDEKQHNSSIGSVVVKDDCVELTIGWEVMTNWAVIINKPVTFTFTPTGNNFYTVDGGKCNSIQ